jgi:lambda repressor-like predicted transcriptional regulator
LNSDRILKALSSKGHSYASIGRNLDPPVTRQSVRDVVIRVKISTRIMLALAEAIGISPAKVFPERAYLFEKENTGKASHRSTVKADSVKTSAREPQVLRQSQTKAKPQGQPHADKGEDGPRGKEIAA